MMPSKVLRLARETLALQEMTTEKLKPLTIIVTELWQDRDPAYWLPGSAKLVSPNCGDLNLAARKHC